MKGFRFFTKNLIFVLILSALAFAQTEKPQFNESEKIGIVFWSSFEDRKDGINELIEAYNKLDEEFKPQTDELRLMGEKIKKMEEGFKYVTGPGSPVLTQEMVNNKLKEYQLAVSQFKGKQEEIKLLYEKRAFEATADIRKKIIQAVDTFAMENGYKRILNISKSDESMILAKSEKADLSKAFIKYYNENFPKTKTQ